MSKTIIQDCVEAQLKQTPVMDAGDGVFFARELESLKAKSYDKKYADVEFRETFPVGHETPEGATAITMQSYDRVGVSKIINGYGTDLPRVDIRGKEYSVPVKQVGEHFGYTTMEISSSQMVGKSLDARRMSAARESNERKLDQIAFYGDADAGIVGLKTSPGIPLTTVATGAGGVPWVDKTPDEILFDLNNAVAVMRSTTLKKENPSRLLLPVSQYQLIRSTPRSANSDTTILQYFLDNNEHISEVMELNKLDGFGTAGADVFVIYNPDPDNVVFEMSMEHKQYPPQLKGLDWTIPCESRTGGLNVFYPLSFAMWEGI